MGTLVTPKPTSMVWDSVTNRFVPVGEATESPVQGLLDDVFLDRNVFDANVLNNTLYNMDSAQKNKELLEERTTLNIPRNDAFDSLLLDQTDRIEGLFGGQSGIQTSQEMFDEAYQDALAADALDSMEQEGQFSSGNATLDMLNQAIADKEAGVIRSKNTGQGFVEMTPEESDAAYDVTIKGLTDKLVGMGVPVSDLPVVKDDKDNEGGYPSMLQEALGKLQTQDSDIVLDEDDEDDEGDDEKVFTFGDLLNDLLKPPFPTFDPSTVGPFIPQGGEVDDTGVDPGNGTGDLGNGTGDNTGDDTGDGTGDGTADPVVPPVAPADPVPSTVPSTQPDGDPKPDGEPDPDPTPDPTVVSDEIVTDDQAVVTIPEIIKPKSTESKRQLFDIVTSATPITESILFSPQFVDLDNIQLGMFDAFLKASGGK